MKYSTDCMLWKGAGFSQTPTPIFIFDLVIEINEIKALKRILLKMRLTYPEEIPVRCSENTLKQCHSFSSFIGYFNRKPCPATAYSDHIYIGKRRIQMFLEKLKEIEKEEGELCQIQIKSNRSLLSDEI